tara:strand:+ start:70 stop:465 length:396 start_codon:yes stop_codon:yes gene_type:complete
MICRIYTYGMICGKIHKKLIFDFDTQRPVSAIQWPSRHLRDKPPKPWTGSTLGKLRPSANRRHSANFHYTPPQGSSHNQQHNLKRIKMSKGDKRRGNREDKKPKKTVTKVLATADSGKNTASDRVSIMKKK